MAALVAAPALGWGEESAKVIWSCREQFGTNNVLWLVEWSDKSYIKVFEERIPAKYYMDGLRKRWDWGVASDHTYDYSVVMEPNGTAFYLDDAQRHGC